jgi:uncharacterized protein
MAVNLPPHYHDAEAEYKKANKPEEKLAALKKMWVILPKHKASEKVQAILKTKMADLNDEIERKSSVKKASPNSYKIPRQGSGQYVLLGGPNAGKSSLLRKLTKATPEVAPYPFTTREPSPGMMEFENIRMQLIDLPPITADFYETYLNDFTRVADGALLLVDLADDDGPFAVETVMARLKEAKRLLVAETPETADEDPSIYYLKTILVANKIDADGAQDRLDILLEMLPVQLPIVKISCETGVGLDELKQQMYKSLGVMRIYGKMPGKQPDMNDPYVIAIGGTVLDFAEAVHTELAETMKAARVWGMGVMDGQTVKRDHVLHERDVVELQM